MDQVSARTRKLFPYTVVSTVLQNGAPVTFERDFVSPGIALKYKQDMISQMGDQLDSIDLVINNRPAKRIPASPVKKQGHFAIPGYIKQIYFRRSAFVMFIGYDDGAYELYVSGTKSVGRGVGVPFSLVDFDYYQFVLKMGHEACSWKEAKNIAHNIQKVKDQVRFLAGNLHFELNGGNIWDNLDTPQE